MRSLENEAIMRFASTNSATCLEWKSKSDYKISPILANHVLYAPCDNFEERWLNVRARTHAEGYTMTFCLLISAVP